MEKRILILDDNPAILEVVTEALTYEGYGVKDISQGKQLFGAIKDFSPQLILLDHNLSDVKGADLCLQLKLSDAYKHIPVIIFSAYSNPGEQLSTGCDGYLYKPFDLTELSAVVRNLLPASMEVSNED